MKRRRKAKRRNPVTLFPCSISEPAAHAKAYGRPTQGRQKSVVLLAIFFLSRWGGGNGSFGRQQPALAATGPSFQCHQEFAQLLVDLRRRLAPLAPPLLALAACVDIQDTQTPDGEPCNFKTGGWMGEGRARRGEEGVSSSTRR